MRFESLQQDVGWNLENHIWHEEDRKSGVVLCSLQIKVLRKSKHSCVGDVGPYVFVSAAG